MDRPTYELKITAETGRITDAVAELFQHRALLWMFVQRQFRVRYKQAYFGVALAVFVPVVTALIFSLVFSQLTRFSTGSVSYLEFFFSGFIIWQFFSNALLYGSRSLVDNSAIIGKVYFPRQILPISAIFFGILDLLISCVCLLILIVWMSGAAPSVSLMALAYFLLCVLAALGLAIGLAAINAIFRDVGILIPTLVQIWMFASPIIYPIGLVPESALWLYEINPMVAVIEGWRSAFLDTPPPSAYALVWSCAWSVLFFFAGLRVFVRVESALADNI